MLLFITQNIQINVLETIESSYQIRFNGSLVYALTPICFNEDALIGFQNKNLQQSLTNF